MTIISYYCANNYHASCEYFAAYCDCTCHDPEPEMEDE